MTRRPPAPRDPTRQPETLTAAARFWRWSRRLGPLTSTVAVLVTCSTLLVSWGRWTERWRVIDERSRANSGCLDWVKDTALVRLTRLETKLDVLGRAEVPNRWPGAGHEPGAAVDDTAPGIKPHTEPDPRELAGPPRRAPFTTPLTF